MLLAAAVIATFLGAPTRASADVTQVFGSIPCTPQDGVRFCEGTNATRVRTFDAVPLDVNVALPAQGEGPFPLVVLLHGYGGSKNDNTARAKRYASRGYGVLAYTARGFNGSCGTLANRNDPVCLQRGWLRLADSRFEVRDTQHLAGLLADQGVVDPQKIGVTGGSYGGGQSVQLAVLRDRIRKPDGSYEPWVSPVKKLPMRIAAAAPVIPWTDLAYSLAPNGRTLDYTIAGPSDDIDPIGVLKTSFVAGLYALGQASGFYAPPGVDPDADLTRWYARVNAGEPYDSDPMAEDIVSELASNHSGYYLDMDREPPPTLISNGFTDDLFPVDEAVRYANKVNSLYPGATLAQLHFDYGHQRGQNKAADAARLESSIEAWFDRHLQGLDVPTVQGVEALTQTCPKDAPSGGPFRGPSWLALSPGEVTFSAPSAAALLSGPRDPRVDQAVDPISGPGACATAPAADQPGTATYRLPDPGGDGYTLLGSPTVIADLEVTGVNAALTARLWDVGPDGARQTLVARALYRPEASGRQVFQLHPNGWRFAPGHTPKLELIGTDVPYSRAPNGQYRVGVSNLELRLPVADGPGSSPDVKPPKPAVLPAGAEAVKGVKTVRLGEGRRARSRLRVTARGTLRKGRYRVKVRGRVAPRGGGARRTRRCRGPLSVAIRARGRRVVRRDTKVRRDCLFARTVTFRRARLAKSERRRGSRARTRVVVRFGGNRALKASRASARVRLRPAR
jgi:predicted esterase